MSAAGDSSFASSSDTEAELSPFLPICWMTFRALSVSTAEAALDSFSSLAFVKLNGAVILVHLLLLQLALDDSSRDVDLPVVVRRLRIRRAYLGHGLLWCHFTRRHHVSHEGERVLDQQLCAATRDAVPALREHLILKLRLLVQGQSDIPVVEDLLDGAPCARLRQLLL